jgi:hypothetical protein
MMSGSFLHAIDVEYAGSLERGISFDSEPRRQSAAPDQDAFPALGALSQLEWQRFREAPARTPRRQEQRDSREKYARGSQKTGKDLTWQLAGLNSESGGATRPCEICRYRYGRGAPDGGGKGIEEGCVANSGYRTARHCFVFF